MDSSASVSSRLSLIKQINFPRIILPVSSVIANFIDYVLSLSILVVVFAAARVTVNWPYLGLFLLALVILIIFAYGLGLILASLSVFYTDIQFLVGNLFQMWFFLSPILYPAIYVIEGVKSKGYPPILQTIYFCNPIAPLMMAFRSIIPGQVPTNPDHGGFPEYYAFLAISAGISLLVFIIGLLVFKRFEGNFAKQV
jgi:ABC-type polysaccharide/polyol phosphate export permease